MHGFLSREGINPQEFLELSRAQLAAFPDVKFHCRRVVLLRGEGKYFLGQTEGGNCFTARTVLLATGIVDKLPEIPGLAELYGRSVHHCPYCDGWEHRDQPIAVYGKGEQSTDFAKEMLLWSRDIIYCSDGRPVKAYLRGDLASRGIVLNEFKVERLVGKDGRLQQIEFSGGPPIHRTALFFQSDQRQNCDLARQLGCEIDQCQYIACSDGVRTRVPGVFTAGNASQGLQLAIVAAAEGAKAAHAINTYLLEDE